MVKIKKWRLKRTWKVQINEESMKLVCLGKMFVADSGGLLALIRLPLS